MKNTEIVTLTVTMTVTGTRTMTRTEPDNNIRPKQKQGKFPLYAVIKTGTDTVI